MAITKAERKRLTGELDYQRRLIADMEAAEPHDAYDAEAKERALGAARHNAEHLEGLLA